jgi:hypothetical protein
LIRKLIRKGLAVIISLGVTLSPALLPATAGVAMFATAGCSQSQFDAYLNVIGPAVLDVLQIVAVFSGKAANTSISDKVSADVAAIEKLYADYQSAAASQKAGVQGEIQAAFTTLNSDLGSVFQLAQVSDKNTQAKITVLVGLIETGVNLALAVINPPVAAASLKGAQSPSLTAAQLVSSFNATLTAKTGNAKVDALTPKLAKLHVHGKFVRMVTFGAAK